MNRHTIKVELSIHADSDQEALYEANELMHCYSKGTVGSEARLADWSFRDKEQIGAPLELPNPRPRALSTRTISAEMSLDVDSEQEALYVADELMHWMHGDHPEARDDSPRLASWSFPDAHLIGEPVKPVRKLHCSATQAARLIAEHGLEDAIHALALCVGLVALKEHVDHLSAECERLGISYEPPALNIPIV
jgi:hypothetical protein